MADVMKTTTKTMGEMNKVMNPAQLNKTLQEFSKESAKLDMTDEMSEYSSNSLTIEYR
jgi:charged multivesicular body protein 2B